MTSLPWLSSLSLCWRLHVAPGIGLRWFHSRTRPISAFSRYCERTHLHGNVQESCVAAFTLVELAKDPGHLENLRRLEQVTYGGGALWRRCRWTSG